MVDCAKLCLWAKSGRAGERSWAYGRAEGLDVALGAGIGCRRLERCIRRRTAFGRGGVWVCRVEPEPEGWRARVLSGYR